MPSGGNVQTTSGSVSTPAQTSIKSHISSDRPVESLAEDRYELQRHFIPRLARIGLEWPTQDGLVVGLFGTWGIGKTSILNMFRDYVDQQRGQGKERYKNVIFASFNPWFYEDTGALVTSFFATIAAELGTDQNKPWAGAAKTLRAMGSFLTVASKGLTVFGVSVDVEKVAEAARIAAAASQQTGEIASGLASVAELAGTGQKKFEQYRTDVKEALKHLGAEGGRIVVLIDDVDRLNKAELFSLLRLVRTVADLPYVTLVIAMDDERVRKVLEKAVFEGYGQSYLDKIVQVALHVPLPGREAMTAELVAELEATFQKMGVPLPKNLTPSEFRIQRVALDLLASTIRTPRDLARYMNGLRTLLLAGENPDVDQTDAALIEALHIFHPDIYDRVRRHKDFLTERSDDELDIGFDISRERGKAERIKAARSKELDLIIHGGDLTLGPKAERLVRGLLDSLFGDVTNPMAHGHSSAYAAERKIRSPKYFDNYFRYAKPIGAVTRSEVDAFVKQVLYYAQQGFIEGITKTMNAALANQEDLATEQLIEDLGFRLKDVEPDLMEKIGEGIITASNQLPPDITIGLLTVVLDAATHAGLLHIGNWTSEKAKEQVHKLLRAAIHSRQLSTVQIHGLLENQPGRWLREDELLPLAAAWIQRVDEELLKEDPLEKQHIAEWLYVFRFTQKMITALDKDSPTSSSMLQAHLIDYVNRRPERIPQVLYLAAQSESDGIPRLLSPRYSRENTLAWLKSVFGDYSQLRPALEAFRKGMFEAGDYAQLLKDFEDFL